VLTLGVSAIFTLDFKIPGLETWSTPHTLLGRDLSPRGSDSEESVEFWIMLLLAGFLFMIVRIKLNRELGRVKDLESCSLNHGEGGCQS
jgi:hypothetical protein